MTPAERDQVALLLAEVAQLRAELAAVRAELAAVDRGVVEAGLAGSRALERANAIGRGLAGAYTACGLPVPDGCLPARPRLIQGGAS